MTTRIDTSTKPYGKTQTIAAAATAEQGPSVAVADGMAVVLQNDPENPSGEIIRVADTKANAEGADAFFKVTKGNSILLHVRNLNEIWVKVANNGSKVNWLTEVYKVQ